MKTPRIESLVLVFCFLAVVVWAVSKCNARRAKAIRPEYAETEARPIKRDTVFVPAQSVQTPVNTAPVSSEPYRLPANPGEVSQTQAVLPQERTIATQPKAAAPQPATVKPQTIVKNQTTLWVTIDGLNLRREPGLKAETVAKLDLYDQVYFMNEKSDYTQEINLGKEMVTDYWVKVKTKSGKVGWVFGAGVHYYKQKRKGTLE